MVSRWFCSSKESRNVQPNLFELMSELGHKGTTFSTFTAAAQVRRDLTAAGFVCEKVKGFAYKREMLRGSYSQESDQSLLLEDKKKSLKVVVLGAGVAGVTCAYQLKQAGFDNVELDSEGLAKKASGNPVGIIQPYLTGGFTPGDQLIHQGFSLTKHVVQQNLSSNSKLFWFSTDDHQKAFRKKAC